MIVQYYRKFIPESIRSAIYELFLADFLFYKRNFKSISRCRFIYLFRFFLPRTKENAMYAFMGRYGLTHYPQPYSLAYRKKKVSIHYDAEVDLNYVLHEGKKLYFPLSKNKFSIQTLYRDLLVEQDVLSPHRYIKNLEELKEKILLDIGSAEGIFTLEVIDFVEHAYLFECDEDWIKPLQYTFEPWKEKVTFIRKFVNDKNDDNNLSIDAFLKDKPIDNLFIKMDIEGAEQAALKGAEDTLKNSTNIICSICTYHREEDAMKIENFLRDNGFQTEFSGGYIYLFSENIFRKVIVRGRK